MLTTELNGRHFPTSLWTIGNDPVDYRKDAAGMETITALHTKKSTLSTKYDERVLGTYPASVSNVHTSFWVTPPFFDKRLSIFIGNVQRLFK